MLDLQHGSAASKRPGPFSCLVHGTRREPSLIITRTLAKKNPQKPTKARKQPNEGNNSLHRLQADLEVVLLRLKLLPRTLSPQGSCHRKDPQQVTSSKFYKDFQGLLTIWVVYIYIYIDIYIYTHTHMCACIHFFIYLLTF